MSKAETAQAKRADELRKEVTNDLASPGGMLFSTTVFGRQHDRSGSLPQLDIEDPDARKVIAEPAQSPLEFLQKLSFVLEETAANLDATYHAA